jgi:hypothetical protein
MAADQPLWRRAFDRIERGVGGPLETTVRSDAFFEVLAHAMKARGAVAGSLEALSRRGLHLLNLPAASDMRRVREQVAAVDRRLLALSKELAEVRRDAGG